MHIPIDISPEKILNKNKNISPIIRDNESMHHRGELSEQIKHHLDESQIIIVVLSKEMIADQNQRLYNNEDAWVYKELQYFIEIGASKKDDFIFLFINDNVDNPEDFPPPMFDKDEAPLILNINEYKENNVVNERRVIAAIAASIFGATKEKFYDYQEIVKKENRRKNILFYGSIILGIIMVSLFFIFREIKSKQETESLNLIEYSNNALEQNDRQAAIIYALEAYDKDPKLPETEMYLRNFAYDDKLIPLRIFTGGNWHRSSNDGTEIFIFRNDGEISILDSRSLKEKDVIRTKYEGFTTKYSVSNSANFIAILGADSIKIYSRKINDIVIAEKNAFRHDGGIGSASSWTNGTVMFDDTESFFIFNSDKEFGVIDIKKKEKLLLLQDFKCVEYFINKQKIYYTTDKLYPKAICYDLITRMEETDVIPIKLKKLLTPIWGVKYERDGIVSEMTKDNYYNSLNAKTTDRIISDKIISYFDRGTTSLQKGAKRYALIKKDSINIYNNKDILVYTTSDKYKVNGIKTSTTGDTIIWWNTSEIHYLRFDSLNNPTLQYTHNYSYKNINDIVFGKNEDLVIMQDDRIIIAKFEELKDPNLYWREIYTPQTINSASEVSITDNKIITGRKDFMSGNDVCIYEYPKDRSRVEQLFDERNSESKIVGDRYIIGVIQPEYWADKTIQCWDVLSDSIVWEKNIKQADVNIKPYSTLSNTVLLEINKIRGKYYSYDIDKSMSNFIVVDVATGDIKYESDLGDVFSQFITDRIIACENSANKTQVVDWKSNAKINIDNLRTCKTDFGINNYDYCIDNNVLAIACDTCVEMLSIRPLNRIKTIPIPSISDSVKLRPTISTNINLSPNGKFLVVNFQDAQDAERFKEQSGCAIWDTNSNCNIGSIEGTNNIWQTFVSNKYIFTSNLNEVCVYDIKTTKLVHTFRDKPVWTSCFIKMPNNNLLIRFSTGYIEVNPNNYNDIINNHLSKNNYTHSSKRYVENNDKLIDIIDDRQLFDSGLYSVSEFSKSLMRVERSKIENFDYQSENKIIPFEDIKQLRNRLKKKVQYRILSEEEKAVFEN